LKNLNSTIVLYESPHRIVKTISQIATYWGEDQMIGVVKEISKIHEKVIRGTSKDLLEEFQKSKSLKGEFVIVIPGENQLPKKVKTIRS